ncbi:hypothetical protein [Bremerella cremea]|uniref:hypothetical protein n=1 Tax=Bremerella cremea TaxID=1031537 RepID=UPI0031E86342
MPGKSTLPFASLSLVWGIAILGSGMVSAAEPSDAPDQAAPKVTAEQLIEKLGADEFLLREQAETEIMQRGREILPLLQEARTSPDPEIRLRANSLYEILSDQFRRKSFQDFIAKQPEVDLPGWKRFRERHGDTTETRKLYVGMLESQWGLLVAMETRPQTIDYMVFQRANKLREELYGPGQTQITEGSAAAMLHATSYTDIRISLPSMTQIQFLLAAPQITASLQDPERSAPLLSVFDSWLLENMKETRFTEEMQYIVLTTCLREGIKSGRLLARELLTKRASPNSFGQFSSVNVTQQMMYSMLAIAKLGDREDIDFLDKYLKDDTKVTLPSVQGDQFTTLLKDVALVAVLHLAGEDPKDFGFPRITTDPNYLYNIRSIGFSTEEQRAAAFEKWDKMRQQMAPMK